MDSNNSSSTTSPDPTHFQTGHVGLNVSDIERSKRFYQSVFGFAVVNESTRDDRRFVFLGDGAGRVVLTLWQQSDGTFATDRPGLHHLSFMVSDIARVREAQARLTALGAHIYHNGVVPHSEGGQSGGVWFDDPDGIRLEIFAPMGVSGDAHAPTADGPTCGFF